jgi:hypothetical protein
MSLKLTLTNMFVASGILASTGAVWYYSSHLEQDPITGRTRFIAFSNEQILQLAKVELTMVS